MNRQTKEEKKKCLIKNSLLTKGVRMVVKVQSGILDGSEERHSLVAQTD